LAAAGDEESGSRKGDRFWHKSGHIEPPMSRCLCLFKVLRIPAQHQCNPATFLQQPVN
jgi:hypothetical protein